MVRRLFDKVVLVNVLSANDFLISLSFALYGITGPNTGLVFDSYLIQVIIWINKDILFVIVCLYLELLLQWLEVALDNLLTTQKKKKDLEGVWKIRGWFFGGILGRLLMALGLLNSSNIEILTCSHFFVLKA